jgi:chromosome segregation ATPase
MALTPEDLQAISSLIQPLRDDMQTVKADIQSMKTDMNIMKADILNMKQDIQNMKQDIQNMKQDIQLLNDRVEKLEQRVTSVELTLENVTNHNIQLLAENHINLVDKLNQAIRVQDKSILYEVQVSDLRSRVEFLEKEFAEMKTKIA